MLIKDAACDDGQVELVATVAVSLLLSSVLVSSPAIAQVEDMGDFYFGSNIGSSLIDTESPYLDDSEHPVSLTGGIVGGYNFSSNFAFEADYSYLGAMPTADGDESLMVLSGAILARYPVSDKANLYLKLGLSAADDEWSPSAGVGVNYRVAPRWLLDFGYRWVADVPDVNSDLYEFSVGWRYLFGVDDTKHLPPIVEPTPEPEPPKPEPVEIVRSIQTESLFGFDSAEIIPNATLEQMAEQIKRNESFVTIVGYTDSLGPAQYNLKLSERRARALKGYLVGQGVWDTHIQIEGRGEANPIASNTTKAGRAQNRRVEIHYQVKSIERVRQ